jgi:hypothetical protein
MRPHHAFRPTITDQLEDRLVLSQGGFNGAMMAINTPVAFLLVDSIPLPTSVQADPQVQMAFVTFVNRYTEDVASVLLAPAADGTVNPAANLPAFQGAVASDLQALSHDLSAALAKSPATATLIPAVQQAIVGNGINSLQIQLAAIATAFGTQGTSVPVFAVSSAQAIQEAANQVITQSLAAGHPRVIQADSVEAFPVANDLHISLVSLATPRLKQAFDAFLKNYASAMNSLLLAPAANLDATRASFRTEVNTALNQLDANVAQILRDLHASAPQIAHAHELLAGSGPQSLRTVIANLPAPAQNNTQSSAILQVLSSKLIANALSQVTNIVSSLVPGLN